MNLRHDALAGAAEWRAKLKARPRLGRPCCDRRRVQVQPGAGNVIAGKCAASLDVRHADDATRKQAVEAFQAFANEIATRRDYPFPEE